jgi:hypothetical protein
MTIPDRGTPMAEQDKADRIPHQVTFYAYPKLIYAWPVIVLGVLFFFIGAPMEKKIEQEVTVEVPADADADVGAEASEPRSQEAVAVSYQHSSGLEVLGWIYTIVLMTVVLTIGVDIERNIGVFWLAVVLALFFLALWLGSQGVAVFRWLYDFFDGLDIQYDRSLGLVLAILLVIPYLVVMLWARIQNKWRITHNEFEHYSWGRADDSLARGAKRVRSTYPDLLELLLAGAGTLIVYSATGRSELRRIHNVPLLPLKRKKINQILEHTAITDTHDAVVDEAEAEREEEAGLDGGNTGDDVGNEQL